ncbi:vegetative cell wall protein gp1-like [Penaeus monodon]|uniref:vegetative cell wall protein gp1-like n=1 Tax=Penaeus monodon TaxID=6687 RepID=UPI0018A70219|nr:vegetative cell wall protein gp1-like [Penaeus monodon]
MLIALSLSPYGGQIIKNSYISFTILTPFCALPPTPHLHCPGTGIPARQSTGPLPTATRRDPQTGPASPPFHHAPSPPALITFLPSANPFPHVPPSPSRPTPKKSHGVAAVAGAVRAVPGVKVKSMTPCSQIRTPSTPRPRARSPPSTWTPPPSRATTRRSTCPQTPTLAHAARRPAAQTPTPPTPHAGRPPGPSTTVSAPLPSCPLHLDFILASVWALQAQQQCNMTSIFTDKIHT